MLLEAVMKTRIFIGIAAVLLFATGFSFAAEKFVLDPAHSMIDFSVRHMVITNVKGFFGQFDTDIMYDTADFTKSSVKVTIHAASINTNNENRDNHLKSADFFDVENFPEIIFTSTKIEKADDGFIMHGDLTMRGVTKQVKFPFVFNGPITDPWGKARFGAEGSLTINRQDYGVSWNKVLDTGGLTVGNDVKVNIQIQAVKAE